MEGISLKEIMIRLGAGTIESGFNNVIIEFKSGGITQWEDRSNLPPNPELQQLLNKWQLLYPAAIQTLSPDINLSPVFDTDTVTNVSSQDLVELNYNFRISINDWLNFGDFGRIDRRLRTELHVLDRILVIIVSEQLQIWQLPWHFWHVFNDYANAIEVFAKPRFTDVRHIKPQHNGKVNILTLSGRDPRLNLNPAFLKTLPQSHSQPIETTSAYEIAERLTQAKPWDILIFNGHGDTIQYRAFQDGVIYLDNDTPLEISRLKIEIQIAVDRGLQIAIFNCCNGLGLAEQLSDLNIPYIIVMREIVPNQCAQNFLRQLLDLYSQGDSFPAAFKQARQSLRLSPGGFAQFADWLPILFHNPLSHHVTWRDLSATVFSRLLPPQIITACNYLSQPNRRIWTGTLLGSVGALLALNLQSRPPIVAWENAIVDRLQGARIEMISLPPAQVAIVNYQAVNFSGHLSNDSELRPLIDRVEKDTKPIAWGINFVINNSTMFARPNVIQGCENKLLNDSNSNNYLQLPQCDRQTIDSILQTANLAKSNPPDFRLNLKLIDRIDKIDLDKISTLSKAEVEKLFNRKIILVGDLDPQEINSLALSAIAIDQIVLANNPQSLPLSIYRSTNEQFLWIFSWLMLTGMVTWHSKWKLFFLMTIAGEIAITGRLLLLGQGLPLVITPVAMIFVGGAVRVLMTVRSEKTARHLPRSL